MRRAAAAMSTLAELTDRMDPRPGGRCLVAVSGGADSVALLGMMRVLRDRGDLRAGKLVTWLLLAAAAQLNISYALGWLRSTGCL